MAVEVQIDGKQLARLTKALAHIKNGVPKAVVPAINRSLDKGRTVIKREIRKEYLIRAKDIPIAVHGARMGKLSGEIIVAQGMLPLGKFRVRPMAPQRRKNKVPVFAQVKVKGGATMPGAFVINTGNYVGPYRRKGSARLPIKKLLTIGAGIMASQPNVGPAANKAMGDTLDKRLDHEMKRVLAQAGGKS